MYPEHEKLKEVSAKSQIIGEFLDFYLLEKEWEICEYNEYYDNYYPVTTKKEAMLAEYFGIDLDKLYEEKEQMIGKLREMN